MRVRKSVIWHFLLEPLFFAQAVPSDIILYKKGGCQYYGQQADVYFALLCESSSKEMF